MNTAHNSSTPDQPRRIQIHIPDRQLSAAAAARQRRDAGTIRIGQRDIIGMDWTAEQGVMRLDQLAALFTALSERSVSNDAARKTIERWTRQGWATMRTLLQGEPPYIWLTGAGMKITGHDYPAAAPSLGTLRHSRITTDIRIHLQSRYPGTSWRSERAIRATLPRRERGSRSPHVPDGELHGGGGHILAVENELTAKTSSRTRAIMLGLLARRHDYDQDEPPQPNTTPRYRAVWYYAAPEAAPTVRAAQDTLPGDLQQRLGVYDWPKT